VSARHDAARDRLSRLLELALGLGELSAEERKALSALVQLAARTPTSDP